MDNYEYWQQEGTYWKEEYERRRHSRYYFIAQEAAIAYFLELNHPAKILEFGCGIGRHLKYLNELNGLEIHGCDQSPTMLQAIQDWAGQTWFEQHIKLIKPTGTLPYGDGIFDITFTAEVLIHTRPEDVKGRLQEILRISKKGIFHSEPDLDVELYKDAHHGCWNHDYVKAYEELGFKCNVLPKFFENQSFYIVNLDGSIEAGLLKDKIIAEKSRQVESLFEGIASMLKKLQTLLARSVEETNLTRQTLENLSGKMEQLHDSFNKRSELADANFESIKDSSNKKFHVVDTKLESIEKHYANLFYENQEKSLRIRMLHEQIEAMKIDRHHSALKRLMGFLKSKRH